MNDFFRVNILNEDTIPWILEKGPLFGYEVSAGLYDLLSRDPRVIIEITDYNLYLKRKSEYEARKKMEASNKQPEPIIEKPNEIETKSVINETPKEGLKLTDKIEIKLEPKKEENKDEFDAELDSVLDTVSEQAEMQCKIPDESTTEFKSYNNKELSDMTKAQMKKILIERGYNKGPYAPKYHDNLEDLIMKIKRTQM